MARTSAKRRAAKAARRLAATAPAAAAAVQDKPTPPSPIPEATHPNGQGANKRSRPDDMDDGADGWQVVDRHAKRKKKNMYPAFDYFEGAKMNHTIRLTELRDLVLYIQADGTAPQWIGVSHRLAIKKVVVVMVPGLEEGMFHKSVDFATFGSGKTQTISPVHGPDDYRPIAMQKDSLPDALGLFAAMFQHRWPIRSPGDDRGTRLWSPMETFLTAPAPRKQNASSNSANTAEKSWKDERTRVTEFVATLTELEDNGFMVHPALAVEEGIEAPSMPEGWVATRVNKLEDGVVPEEDIESGSVTAGRHVLALDCEMCMTGPDEFSLSRISILDWAGEIVMDELVKPDKPITDYLTQYSGVTAEMLEPVTTSLADIQARLLDLVTPKTILLGHSLDSDLKACQLAHPFVVDTSLLYPHPRGPPYKSSLKYLSGKYLRREIQKGHGADGHNSVEDARACLDLLRQKCEKGKMWGCGDSTGESLFRRLGRAGLSKEVAEAAQQEPGAGARELGKTSAAVDWGDPRRGLGAKATHAIGCTSDEEVVDGVIRAVHGDPDGREMGADGVNFVFARMHELEMVRGWRNRAEKTDAADEVIRAATARAEQEGKSTLESSVGAVASRLKRIHHALPACSAMIVITGSGDPREMARLQDLHRRHKKEYNLPGTQWDQLTVKWTERENEELRNAVRVARRGLGFLTIK